MKKTLLVLVLFFASLSLVFSGGFSLNEGSARAVGMGESFVAVADDLSALFYNPGGAAFFDGTGILVGGFGIFPSVEFEGANPYPGEGVNETAVSQTFLIPNLYFGRKFGKRIFLGTGVSVPFGLGVKWDDKWSGRYITTNSEVQAIDITPTLALKLSENIGIAASFIYRNSKLMNDQIIPFVNPFTFGVIDVAKLHLESKMSHGMGYRVGALFKFNKFNFGVSYSGKMIIDYEGDASFTLIQTGIPALDAMIASEFPASATGKTSLVFPALISGGVSTTIFEGFLFTASVDYMKWSQYNELKIEFEDYPIFSKTVEKHYKDTYTFRFGVEKKLSDSFTIRAGYYYDQGAPELVSLGPDLPDADKHGITFGMSYKVGKIIVDFGNSVVLFKDISTEGMNEDNFNGTYKSYAFISGLNLRFNF